MAQANIDAMIDAFATTAQTALRLGFDGVALQGSPGYLFDQFYWEEANRRTDRYGGGKVERTRFACEVVCECVAGLLSKCSASRSGSRMPTARECSKRRRKSNNSLYRYSVDNATLILLSHLSGAAQRDRFICFSRAFPCS